MLKGCVKFFQLQKISTTYFGYYAWKFKISIHNLFLKFKLVRVLSLSKCCDLREVPDSVGHKKLSDSTCLFCNLLTLKLNFCYNLEELPSNLHKLTELCCLEFTQTKCQCIWKNWRLFKYWVHFSSVKIVSSVY